MSVSALVLLSGGLDSMLAAKLLIEQNIEVTGICFFSNFYNTDKARKAAEQLGIKLLEIDISEEMLNLVKNPPSGLGKNMNPCIDCHAMMFKKAGELDYDFIATGEVVGQRPFSQTKSSLNRVEKLAGLPLIRPLSQKLLAETDIEKKGLVDREKLLDINGRNRERQIELAKKYGIKDYPSPAGGCILTDPMFSQKLKKMVEIWPNCSPLDVELLKYGRVFWKEFDSNDINDINVKNILVIVGRNEADNIHLTKLAKKGDFVLELKEQKGPTGLVRTYENITDIPSEIKLEIPEKFEDINNECSIFEYAALLTGFYYTKNRGKKVTILINKI